MPSLRSVVAVVAGYLIFGVSAVVLFRATRQDPHAAASMGFMALSTLYGVVFAVTAGFVAVSVATRHTLAHAGVVGALIALAAIASLLTRPGGGAVWSQLAALLLMAPATLLGGALRAWLGRPGR